MNPERLTAQQRVGTILSCVAWVGMAGAGIYAAKGGVDSFTGFLDDQNAAGLYDTTSNGIYLLQQHAAVEQIWDGAGKVARGAIAGLSALALAAVGYSKRYS